MKQLAITFSILVLMLSACNSGGTSHKYHTKKPRPEMIFGEEKNELQAYVEFLDSISTISIDLPIDTSGMIKGSFICMDILADSSNQANVGEMLAQSDAEGKGEKLYKYASARDLKAILKGEKRLASYREFLTKTKNTTYLVLINNILYQKPKMRGKDAFDSGQIISLIQVIDLRQFVIVKQVPFQAENSDNVSTITDLTGTGMLYDAVLEQDLWKSYRKVLSEELNNLFHH